LGQLTDIWEYGFELPADGGVFARQVCDDDGDPSVGLS
jgi:hypothetical protein